MIKYFVYPGEIDSNSDGDTHYISAKQLVLLYGVDPRECKIILKPQDELGYNVHEYKHLQPRKDGNYDTNITR